MLHNPKLYRILHKFPRGFVLFTERRLHFVALFDDPLIYMLFVRYSAISGEVCALTHWNWCNTFVFFLIRLLYSLSWLKPCHLVSSLHFKKWGLLITVKLGMIWSVSPICYEYQFCNHFAQSQWQLSSCFQRVLKVFYLNTCSAPVWLDICTRNTNPDHFIHCHASTVSLCSHAVKKTNMSQIFFFSNRPLSFTR